MKVWKQKALIPRHGLCTVKEYNDKEATNFKPPVSHGFVVLYKGGKHVGWCGINFARDRTVKGRVKKMSEAQKTIQRVRKQRAENMLESALWDVINQYHQKPATKCESKLVREDILHVLCGMGARVASELQGYVKR